MQKSDEIQRELEGISQKIADLPRENAFKVDDDYFHGLTTHVRNRIHLKLKSENVSRRHFFGPTTIRWMAASFAILILGSVYYYRAWKSFNPGNYTNTESYIIENFDEGTITDYLSDIQVKDQKKIEILDNSIESIDEELIIEEF
jgi:hypothetical protein